MSKRPGRSSVTIHVLTRQWCEQTGRDQFVHRIMIDTHRQYPSVSLPKWSIAGLKYIRKIMHIYTLIPTICSMLRLTKLQTLCKETCSQGHTKTSTQKSTLTDLIAEARSKIAVKSTKTKLERYLEDWKRRLRHFLHWVFSHNYITPSHNCRVASATRTKTLSTFISGCISVQKATQNPVLSPVYII